MRTRNVHVITENWRFHCLHCQARWEHLYEAWHGDDGHGGDAVAWRLGGVASQPPWIDPACPACLSLHVKTLPAGPLVPEQR